MIAHKSTRHHLFTDTVTTLKLLAIKVLDSKSDRHGIISGIAGQLSHHCKKAFYKAKGKSPSTTSATRYTHQHTPPS